jgi:DNA polymerase/3'-5' exonuclease PolX
VNYDEAKKLADDLIATLRPLCVRAEIAGSVRRLKQTDIKDVEIVAIPNPVHAFELLRIVNSKWGKPSAGEWPSKYTKIRSQYSIDLFWPNAETWGLIYFIRTGPAEFGHRMLGYWKQITNGGYSEDGVLHLADGTPVFTPEEADVFRVLEQYGKVRCPFIPPEKRLAIKPSKTHL